MSPSHTGTALQLYSLTASPDLKQTVLAITDQGHDVFRTGAFTHDENGVLPQWLEAWKNPDTKLWTVERYTRLEGSLFMKDPQPVLRSACFFDAVHYCARFETSERKMGGQEVAFPQEEGAAHFRDAGESAGIPFDHEGMPLVAARGLILTGGIFDSRAREVARRTHGMALQVSCAGQTNYMKEVLQHIAGADEAVVTAAAKEGPFDGGAEKLQISAVFREAAEALKNYTLVLAWSLKNEFEACDINHQKYNYGVHKWTKAFLKSCFSLGAWACLAYAGRNTAFAPTRYLERQHKIFDDHMSRLPEGPDKSLFREFGKALFATGSLERVAAIYTHGASNRQQGLNRARDIRKAFALIADAVSVSGMAPAETERLQVAFMEGRLPASGVLFGKLCRDWEIKTAGKSESHWDHEKELIMPPGIEKFMNRPKPEKPAGESSAGEAPPGGGIRVSM